MNKNAINIVLPGENVSRPRLPASEYGTRANEKNFLRVEKGGNEFITSGPTRVTDAHVVLESHKNWSVGH